MNALEIHIKEPKMTPSPRESLPRRLRPAHGLAAIALAAGTILGGATQASAATLIQDFSVFDNGSDCNSYAATYSHISVVWFYLHDGKFHRIDHHGWSCKPGPGGVSYLYWWI